MVAQKCQDGSANFQLYRKSCRIDDVKTEMRVDDFDGDWEGASEQISLAFN